MKKILIKGESVLNVPNLISLYRLLIFPVILYFALTGREQWYVILLCISLISDVLDGNIARIFKLQTNIADMTEEQYTSYGQLLQEHIAALNAAYTARVPLGYVTISR